MKNGWFTLLILFAFAGTLRAQEPNITNKTPVNTSILHQWLHSGDPRLIAWVATFARRTHDTRIISELPTLLENWNMPPAYDESELHTAWRRAVSALLDALIQENAKVPVTAIEAVAPSFPNQAIILMSRLPLAESRTTLNDWTYGFEGGWNGRILARVAAMMLAKDAESLRAQRLSLVARIVEASELDVQISIVTASSGEASGASGTCGDSLGQKLPPGWPQIYAYAMSENDTRSDSPLLIDLDGDRISFQHVEENRGWGSCGAIKGVAPLNSSTRHRLIAYWLGVQPKDMAWQPVERFSIVWKNQFAYILQLGAFVGAEREKLQATVEALQQRGFLTQDQADTIAPKLLVKVECDIKPCPLKSMLANKSIPPAQR